MESNLVKSFRVGSLNVEVHSDKYAAGMAAALSAADAMRKMSETRVSLAVIFATGVSQMQTLDALTQIKGLPWPNIVGFHMDEYIGIPADHPASFRRYLRERLTRKVTMKHFHEIDGSAPDPEQTANAYAALLRAADPQLCLLGIGENGHLAFNDPGVADFSDPRDAKIVHLDEACRRQQVAEGWFASDSEVAAAAITLTIPTLLRVPRLIVSVPGPRKASVMRRALSEPFSTDCPATILRTHPDATVYLDLESAAELDGVPITQ